MAKNKPYDLIICGGGPVGLLSGLAAIKSGLRTLIVEKQEATHPHSRSIGIHPPSLRILSDLDLLPQFRKKACIIKKGLAMENRERLLGELNFSTLPEPFNFIITLPQWQTTRIIEEQITNTQSDALLRGFKVLEVKPAAPHGLTARIESMDGSIRQIHSKYFLACDGKYSAMRRHSGIAFRGSPYRRRYAMGDFEDNTGFGSHAVIFLSKSGLVESFPLPGNTRRWVAEEHHNHRVEGAGELSKVICSRTGITPVPDSSRMFSEFGVERYMADTFWADRVILAGDAAHVVSPIGGQGMNLGWINAIDAIDSIKNAINNPGKIHEIREAYQQRVQKKTLTVIRRAEFNMTLGGSKALPSVRNYLVGLLLGSPLQSLLKQRFTMIGLS